MDSGKRHFVSFLREKLLQMQAAWCKFHKINTAELRLSDMPNVAAMAMEQSDCRYCIVCQCTMARPCQAKPHPHFPKFLGSLCVFPFEHIDVCSHCAWMLAEQAATELHRIRAAAIEKFYREVAISNTQETQSEK